MAFIMKMFGRPKPQRKTIPYTPIFVIHDYIYIYKIFDSYAL